MTYTFCPGMEVRRIGDGALGTIVRTYRRPESDWTHLVRWSDGTENECFESALDRVETAR